MLYMFGTHDNLRKSFAALNMQIQQIKQTLLCGERVIKRLWILVFFCSLWKAPASLRTLFKNYA